MRLTVLALFVGAALVTIALVAQAAWQDGDKPAQAQGTITIGFDMNTAGNSCPGDGVSNCSLGTIDSCVQVPSGGGVLTIDVFLDGLPQLPDQPTKGGIVGYQYVIEEKIGRPVGTVAAYSHADQLVNLMYQAPPLQTPFDGSDLPGSSLPPWRAVVVDLSAGIEYNPPFTKGVLSRLQIDTTGTPDGVYGLTLNGLRVADLGSNDYCAPESPTYGGCEIRDANASPQPYGVIAVGVPCGSPLPTPSPTPSPTPTSTAAPTPTPSTSVTPTPTGTPGPQPDLAAGWNYICYLGTALPVSEALADLMPGVQALYHLRSDQGYDKWFPDRPDLSTITDLSSYEALFILMANDADWPQEPAAEPPTGLDLTQGWNGACYSGQTKDVPSATASIAGQYEALYLLAAGQGWQRFIPARPEISNLPELPRFAAVLMLVSQPGVTHWAFDP